MSLRVEIERVRLTGVDLPPEAADRLRGDLERVLATELDMAEPPTGPIARQRMAAGIRRVVAGAVERSVS